MKTILGIETSCDDTSLGIIRGEAGAETSRPEILAFETFSQEHLLEKWGGVIPEIAARNHLKKLVPLMESVFEKASIKAADVDAVAVTTHPGLLGPLLTGLSVAKSLSLLFKIPLISVNHLYAHIEAVHLTHPTPYPYLGTVVSGGHGIYFLVHSSAQMDILGKAIDDAPGEAFDKGGKMLGLKHPGGKSVDEFSQKAKDKNAHSFPIGLASSRDANLSFSGVKTSLRCFLQQRGDLSESTLHNVCYAYQDAIVKALKLKAVYALRRAIEITGLKTLPIVVGGGVASNSHLRDVFKNSFETVSFVEKRFCTDNGVMIANYGLRSFHQAVPFPKSLELDARGKFL